ncbi:MAG: DUF222 domain-containing protein, partial [Acidimicrobiales bacterium]|nr:DUF222 domain-containing protein [Acidimicrobiales bacterium]
MKWSLGSVRMGPLEPGVAAVAEALASLEAPVEVDDDCLHERTVDLLRVRSLVDAALAGHVPEWNHRALWATDGSKSPSARLARDANCAKGTAGGIVRQASAMSRMPLTREALADGRISTDHARRLVQACTDERLALFLEAEAHLVGEAVRLAGDHKGFCRVVSHWEHIVDDQLHDPTDPDDEPPERKRRKAERDFRMAARPEGFDLSGSLPTADGLIVQTQWQHIYDELFEADWAEARKIHGDDTCVAHLSRTVAQRRADALVEMARRASAYKPGSAVARPLVTVMVHAEDLMGPIRETFNGTVLSRRDVAEWLTEADFERIIFDPTGQPVNMTSKDRFFTGLL